MKKTQKLLALLLAVILIPSLLTACKRGETATSPGAAPETSAAPESTAGSEPVQSDRTLNIQTMQDSGTLYPLGVTGGFLMPLYAFYEPLYDTRVDGSRKWILATGLDRISDIEYTLTIREGVKFSNGNPLTAEDVMFTMEACAANPQFMLNVKAVDFEKTKVTGDYTIDLWYTAFNATQEPGFPSMFIMDKESFDEVALSKTPVGTGPYVVEEYVTNSHLSVTARDDYWGGTPYIKNIKFKVINEAAQIVNALDTKDVDMAGPIQVGDVTHVKEELGYNVTISNGGYPDVVMFSLLPGGPLESKEARWAVSHAIDRQAIVDIVYKGLSTVPGYPASKYNVDLEDRFLNMHDTYSIGYNVEKAKELAEQSGLAGKTLRLITNGAANYNTMAEMIQANLDDIGVDAEIVPYDQATYFPTLMDATAYDIALFGPAAPSMMAVDILANYPMIIPQGWTGADRDNFGEISMGAIGTYDKTQRGEKLYESLKIWVDVCPWFSLSEVVMPRAISPDLTGVEYFIAGSIYYQDIAFK